jgi:hypothetical protein
VKNFFVVVLVLSIFYGIYTVGMLGYQWFQVSNVVDDVVENLSPRIPERPDGSPRTADMLRLKKVMLERLELVGVTMDERAVELWEENRFIEVRVTWDFSVIEFRDQRLAIPLSVERSFNTVRMVR